MTMVTQLKQILINQLVMTNHYDSHPIITKTYDAVKKMKHLHQHFQDMTIRGHLGSIGKPNLTSKILVLDSGRGFPLYWGVSCYKMVIETYLL